MADLQERFIAGRGKKNAQQQKKRFEECDLKIKTLRNKNNELQKQCDNELQSDIKMAIKTQTTFIDHQIKQLKDMLQQLAKDFTDPGSKKRIKDFCSSASKEMERNRRIMSEFVNRASNSNSYYKRESTAYRKSRTEFQNDLPPKKENHLPAVRESSSLIASEEMLSDIKAEQQMMAERTALLKQLQEKNNKINQLINEMGSIIGGEQKDMIDAIDDNLRDAHHNAGVANQQLSEAIVYQKKSKKKYICIVTTIIILLAIAGGMIYFLVAR